MKRCPQLGSPRNPGSTERSTDSLGVASLPKAEGLRAVAQLQALQVHQVVELQALSKQHATSSTPRHGLSFFLLSHALATNPVLPVLFGSATLQGVGLTTHAWRTL